MVLRALFLIFMTLILGACEVKKAADEMRDSTNRIEDYSRNLAKRTNDLERELSLVETHSHMLNHLLLLFDEGSQGQSFLGRQFDRFLYSQDARLFAYSGAAVYGMIFQVWKGDYGDTVEFLDMRFDKALEFFFARITEYVPRDFKIDRSYSIDRNYRALGALSTQMDQINADYEKALKANGLPYLDLYHVFVMALRNRHKAERKEILPRTAARILQFHREAIYLLQLRHNFYPMLVVARITDFQDRMAFNKLFWMSRWGVAVDSSQLVPSALVEMNLWLKRTQQTRQDLLAMGIQPEYNSFFQQIVNKVNFDQDRILSAAPPPSGFSENERLLREFADLYKRAGQPIE